MIAKVMTFVYPIIDFMKNKIHLDISDIQEYK